MRVHVVGLAVAALLAGCNDPLAVSDGTLRANPRPPGVNVENASDRPVYLFMADKNQLALIDWGACTGPGCPSLAAGASMLKPCSEIAGCGPDTRDVVIYWWRAVPDGAGGTRADSIRTLEVRLK